MDQQTQATRDDASGELPEIHASSNLHPSLAGRRAERGGEPRDARAAVGRLPPVETPQPEPASAKEALGRVVRSILLFFDDLAQMARKCLAEYRPRKVIAGAALAGLAVSVIPIIDLLARRVALVGSSTSVSAHRLMETILPATIVIGGICFFKGHRVRRGFARGLRWPRRELRSRFSGGCDDDAADPDDAASDWRPSAMISLGLVCLGFTLVFTGLSLKEACRLRTYSESPADQAKHELFVPLWLPGPLHDVAEDQLFNDPLKDHSSGIGEELDLRRVFAAKDANKFEELIDQAAFGHVVASVFLILFANIAGVACIAMGLRGTQVQLAEEPGEA